MVDVVSTVEIKYVVDGLNPAISSFDKAAAAQANLASGASRIAVVQDTQAKGILSVTRAMDSYTRAHDPAAKALAAVARGEMLLSNARRQGVSDLSGIERAVSLARTRHEELTKAVNDNAKAIHGHGAAVGASRMQLMEMAHVGRALADELAAGQNPLRALAMEGGRIGQIFSMGGVGGTLKTVGGILGGLVFGWTGLAAAIGATAVVGAASAVSWSNSQDRLGASLEGVGRRSGITLAQLNTLAASAAAAGHITSSEGRSLAGGYAGAGFDAGVTGSLIGNTKRFGRFTGQGTDEAGASLTEAFKDPSKGIALLDRTFGMLNDSVVETIKHQQAQGDLDGARRTLSLALNAGLSQTTDRMWTLSHAMESAVSGVSNFISNLGHSIERGVNGASLEEQRAAARQRVEGLQGQQVAGISGGISEGLARRYRAAGIEATAGQENPAAVELTRALTELAAIEKKIADQDKKASDDQRTARANELSRQGGDIIRSTLPDIGARSSLEAQIKVLRQLGPTSEEATTALGRLENRLKYMGTEVSRVAEDSALATRSTMAWTFAERASVEADKARLAVMRQSGDAALASAKAEEARNAIIAAGNKKADDMLLASQDRAGMIGLTPYQRSLKELDNAHRDFREQNVPGKGDLAPYSAANLPIVHLADAAEKAANALYHIGAGGSVGTAALPSFAAGGKGPIADYIRRAASSRGIDPETAVRVAQSEGLGSYTGDKGSSFGPFQLHYGNLAGGGNAVGGLGDVFTKRTGLDARDPSTVLAQIAFSLDQAKAGGWGPWHGAAKAGIGNWDGIAGGPKPLASTAGATEGQAYRMDRDSVTREAIRGPMDAANNALKDQVRMLDMQRAAAGADTATLAGLTEAQKLLNGYLDNAVKITPELSKQILAYGQATADAARQAENNQKRISGLDTVRDESTSLFSGVGRAIGNRKNVGEALRSWGLDLGGKLIDSGASSLTGSLFGGKGKAGGGIFGDMLGGLFGGGDKSVASATINAGVVTLNSGVGGALGGLGGSGGGTGGGGGLFGFLGGLFGGATPHANGGVFSSRGSIALNRYENGGIANSPQIAMFGEGRGPEAYVPLPDGRSIPVSMHGGGTSGGQSVSVRGGDVHVHGNVRSDQDLTEISGMIAAASRETTRQIQRNFGGMSQTYQARHG
jgi:hypothetical protein